MYGMCFSLLQQVCHTAVLCRYFSSRFPTLLLGVFFFALKHLDQDPNLTKYWAVGQHQYVPFNKPWEQVTAAAGRIRPSRGTGARKTSGSGLSRPSASPLPPAAPTPPPAPARVTAAGASQPTSPPPAGAPAMPAAATPPVISFASVVIGSAATPAASSSTGSSTAISSGAAAAAGSLADAPEREGAPVVGYTVVDDDDEELHTPLFPSRPGKQICDFFMKTGHCKYGTECVFDHPPEYAVQLTEQGLPFRAGHPICTFYQKTQQCKFGPSCKFHHPKLVPIYAGSALQQPG